MPAQKPGRSKQDYGTPRIFLDAVERRFGKLSFDLAAHSDNCVVGSYYGPGSTLGEDSLVQDWAKLNGGLWLNPPFGDISPWAKKCASTECHYGVSRAIFFLVPASVGSNWYADHVHGKALVLALRPRLSFDGKNPFPKDCILACYGAQPEFDLWPWLR
jgi:phage N-6-adenine-methyltransferase